MSNYYKEINRAVRQSDFLINEILYIKKETIDLVKLEMRYDPDFNCNFMKQFYKRLALHMENDNNIIYDKVAKVIYYKEDKK